MVTLASGDRRVLIPRIILGLFELLSSLSNPFDSSLEVSLLGIRKLFLKIHQGGMTESNAKLNE